MKKSIITLIILLLGSNSFAYNFDKFSNNIKIEDTISFSTTKQEWERNTNNDYTFKKYITVGTGGFTEFEYNHKKYMPGTTFEFFNNKELIGYNHHNLKFYRLIFNGKDFIKQPLNEKEVQNLFPDAEIIKISELKNNKITVYKPLLKTKTFILWNDTNRDFYKYFFENYHNEKTLFRAVFKAKYPKTFIYSHFGSRDELTPALFIQVKTKGLI